MLLKIVKAIVVGQMKALHTVSESNQLQDELRKISQGKNVLILSQNVFNDFQPRTSLAMVVLFVSDSPWWIFFFFSF